MGKSVRILFFYTYTLNNYYELKLSTLIKKQYFKTQFYIKICQCRERMHVCYDRGRGWTTFSRRFRTRHFTPPPTTRASPVTFNWTLRQLQLLWARKCNITSLPRPRCSRGNSQNFLRSNFLESSQVVTRKRHFKCYKVLLRGWRALLWWHLKDDSLCFYRNLNNTFY